MKIIGIILIILLVVLICEVINLKDEIIRTKWQIIDELKHHYRRTNI